MSPPIAPAKPSATLILLRDAAAGPEVLLVRRSKRLDFHGGAWVFPGGRVDAADGIAQLPDLEAAKNAAIRETQEEAAVCVARETLVTVSHWTTPEIAPKRFATWFFAAHFAGGDIKVDGGEIREHLWLTPGEAIDRHRSKHLDLPPPTFVSLLELANFDACNSALSAWQQRMPPIFTPKFVAANGASYSLYESDAGFDTGDPTLPGPRHRLVFHATGWDYIREGLPSLV